MSCAAFDSDQGDPVIVSRKLLGIVIPMLIQAPLLAGAAESPQSSPSQTPSPLAATPAAAAPKAARDKLFPILEFRVEGNTLIRSVDIERAVMPYLGVGKSINDVDAARKSLETLYHSKGYQTVLVNIPPQEVSAGVVRLAVVESQVGRLEIKGARYHSLDVINATVAELQPGKTPDFNEVQKELAAVNHSDDLHVTPVLRASTTPGQVDVDLDVQDELPLHAMLEVNNRYSANTAHIRMIGEVSYDNLFQSNQSASIQYQTAPEDPANAKIWSISYVIPTDGGPVFALYAVSSDSNIAAVGDLNIIGNGNIYGLRVIEPLPAPQGSSGGSFYHNFTAGFDFKDFKQDVDLQGADQVPSPARYAPFSLDYNATWLGPLDAAKHAGAAITGGRSSTTLDLGASFLVRFLGGTDASQFAVKRAGADPSYSILHPSLTRQQLLPDNFSLVGKISAQLASGPLISNEEFGAGGVDSVRGYAESERLGDNGLQGSLELRSPQLMGGYSPRITESYVYLFTDGAHVRILDPLPDQVSSYRLSSEGVGARFKFRGLTVDLDGARVGAAGYVTRAGALSAQFKVSYAW
jgi:hemolysin activation/secretion protein